MERFREALDAFARGELSQEELVAAARSVLAQRPDGRGELWALLQARHAAGQVPELVFAVLRKTVGGTPADHGEPINDRTRLRASAAPADDRTRMRTGPAAAPDDDRTRIANSQVDDATVMAPRPTTDRPTPTASPSVSGDTGRTGATSPTGETNSTGGTGSTWGDPTLWAEGPSETPQPGMTIKNRFVLETVVGRGGMGVVFKARDLRKEEAQDRNPYVAIKVLNDDFKRHPDALKALQRESRKAQNLAHPNIVNVFDFDRDGATVYMMMEYLDGEPLDLLIKRQWPQGMPIKEALPIIEGMGQALSYAHQKGVVHSDFKPGNVFLTGDGTVKVFDFGIAQATKHAGVEAGEETLFDAGTLGALTPSYASVEMLEGADPDPRDDIYALACVAYQLFTGRHPFDKLPATDARAKKLAPRPVNGLNRRQWRALLEGLAFERAARSADVETFLRGFRTEKRSRLTLIGAAVALLVAGVLAAVLLPGYLQQRRVAQVVGQIEQGDAAQVASALKTVQGFSPQVRASVMQQARKRILAYYRNQVDRHFDAAKGNYDYPGAAQLLAQARNLYPDSAGVQDLADRTLTARNQLLNTLNGSFNSALKAGHLLPSPNKDDVADVLDKVAEIDPKNSLLADPRLSIAYEQQAERAAKAKDYRNALALVDTGLKRFPDDARLSALRGEFGEQLHFQQVQGQVKQLEAKIRPLMGRLSSLSAIAQVRDSVLQLAALYPDDPLLAHLQSDLQRVVGRSFATLLRKHQWQRARKLLADNSALLTIDFTREKARQLQAVAGPGAAQGQSSEVAKDKAAVTKLIGTPAFSASWEAAVQSKVRILAALLPPGDRWFKQTRQQIAQLYLQRAHTLGTAQRFGEATTALRRGQQYAALPAFKQVQADLAQAKAKMEAQVKEEQRQAQVAGQKQTLLTQAAANDVAGAGRTLAALRQELAAQDPFLRKTAPNALGAAYLRLGQEKAAGHHYRAAFAMVEAGLKQAPKLAGLQDAVKRLRPQADLESIEVGLRSGGPATIKGLQKQLRAYRSMDPKTYASASARLSGIVANRVLKVAESNATRAGELLAAARDLFPGSQELAAIRLATPQSASVAPTKQTTAAPPAGRPCAADLAGYGRSPRGTCYNELGPGERGPLLVVVPPGGGITAPYAISKYEISVGNYDLFCKLSHKCAGLAGKSVNLPVTGISVRSARAYAVWLSTRTGYHYAIPTNRQWTHAAKATGGGGAGNYNCQVRMGGKLIKGFGLIDVQTGQPNGWGLVNYVGNAQEWVAGAKGLEVRGGSYQDSLSQCNISLTQASSGKPDPATGFRLVRSLRPEQAVGHQVPSS